MKVLVISVRLHEGRYHGAGDWPPSPARLFQALVAGIGLSGPLQKSEISALQWLEGRSAPIIAAPSKRDGQAVESFVPNNDLDAKGGNPQNIGAIRTKKSIRPRLFDASLPFHYAWLIPDDDGEHTQAEVICRLSDKIYQFGRGVDLAWGWGEMFDSDAFEKQLAEYSGTIHRPSDNGTSGKVLPCPMKGSLLSLETRYAASAKRFETVSIGRSISQSFRQQPKARFKPVSYDCPPSSQLFEIREQTSADTLFAWPLCKAYVLIKSVRDAARDRLISAFPAKEAEMDRWFIGRKPDGTNGGSPEERVRMTPLPSIGFHHADRGIRRILVEVPPGSPIRAEDVFWAFNGLQIPDADPIACLSVATDDSMLRHYGLLGRKARTQEQPLTWQTVTPAALPESAMRRRIDPEHRVEQAKNASEKAAEQDWARAAVTAALRQAGICVPVLEIHVQREPFESKGERVESFASGSRFPKERLWHVQIKFEKSTGGPIAIGDGRFLGLGVMAPVSSYA